MILTIAIPTFNRNQILRQNLAKLLPQITAECRLLILDNHSPEPVAETLADLLAAYPHVSAQVIRHRVNIGGGGNIPRCFELCETPWLWVLGDDDEPLPNAVQVILREIRLHPQALYVNFRCEFFPRTAAFETCGRSDFIRRMDSYGNCLFLSTCLFRVESMTETLQWGIQFATCCAPQLAVLLKSLGDRGECRFSMDQLVHWECPPPERQWSQMHYLLWGPTIADLPLTQAERRSLVEKLFATTPSIGVPLVEVMVMEQRGDIDRGTAIYYIDQIYWRGFRYRPGLSARFRNWSARALVRMPWLALTIMDWWYRLRTGTSLKTHPLTKGLPAITAKYR